MAMTSFGTAVTRRASQSTSRGSGPSCFDMGTGLRYFGGQPNRRTARSAAPACVTHLHWDHTQGLPFFTPMLHPGSSSTCTDPSRTTAARSSEVVPATIRPPLFPISLDEWPGTFRVPRRHRRPSSRSARSTVTARLVPHVGSDARLPRRVERSSASPTISDHQQPYDGCVLGVSDGALELADGVDLVIHDSQYTQDGVRARSSTGVTARSTTPCGWPARCRGAHDWRCSTTIRLDPTTTSMCWASARLKPVALMGLEVIVARRGCRSTSAESFVHAVHVVARVVLGAVFVVSPAQAKWPAAARWPAQAAQLSVSGSAGNGRAVVRADRSVHCSSPAWANRPSRRGCGGAAGGLHRACWCALAQGRRPPCACFGTLSEAARLGPRRPQRCLRSCSPDASRWLTRRRR